MFWQQVHQLDQQLTLAINSCFSKISDPIWVFFSDKLVWVPMYIGIIALLIWKLGWKKGLVVIGAVLLTFGLCDQFSNLIKNLTCRIRPVNDEYMILAGLHILETGGGYSFFSAHAANSFGLSCCTIYGLKSYGSKTKWIKAYSYWMILWATMVALSRIFVGKHYLGDVIAGSIIGIGIGLTTGYSAYVINKKIISSH